MTISEISTSSALMFSEEDKILGSMDLNSPFCIPKSYNTFQQRLFKKRFWWCNFCHK